MHDEILKASALVRCFATPQRTVRTVLQMKVEAETARLSSIVFSIDALTHTAVPAQPVVCNVITAPFFAEGRECRRDCRNFSLSDFSAAFDRTGLL